MAKRIGDYVWETLLTRGILLILLGIFILAWPGITLAIAVMLFAVYALIAGIINLVKGIITIADGWHGVASIATGILGILLGTFMLRNPAATLVTYVILLGLWFIIKGIIEIFSPESKVIGSRGWSVFLGIITVAAGILLLNQPIINGAALYWVVGLYALIAGPITIVQAITVKSLVNNR